LNADVMPKRDPLAVLPPELVERAHEFAEIVIRAAEVVAARESDPARREIADAIRDRIVAEGIERLRFEFYAKQTATGRDAGVTKN